MQKTSSASDRFDHAEKVLFTEGGQPDDLAISPRGGRAWQLPIRSRPAELKSSGHGPTLYAASDGHTKINQRSDKCEDRTTTGSENDQKTNGKDRV